MDFKEEWLRYSGLNETKEDIWLRDLIASLADLPAPDEEESELLSLAGVRLNLWDLPQAAYPNLKEEMLALAHKYAARHKTH